MKFYLSLFTIFQCACTIAFGQLQKIYLNPKAAVGANQSVFIDSLKFHPLEKKKDVTIGKYTSLIISNQYYIILNSFDKEMYFYNKDGKYIKKIAFKRLGDGAWPKYDKQQQQITFFFTNKNYKLTEKDKIKIRTGFANKRNKKYYKKYIVNLKDSALDIKKAQPTAFDILNAFNLENDLYSTYEIDVNKNYKDTTDYELKLYKNTTFIKGYFPYNKKNETKYLFARYAQTVTQESRIPGEFYVTRTYNDTIYNLTGDSITPSYKLVLPMENSLPATFFTTPFKNANDRENFERNNGWLLQQIYISYESDRYIMFMVSFLSNYGQYIYDKKTTFAYNLSKVKPDTATYNLPLLSYNIATDDDNKIYKVISPDDLKEAAKQNVENAVLPDALKQCLKDKNNPQPLIAEFIIKSK